MAEHEKQDAVVNEAAEAAAENKAAEPEKKGKKGSKTDGAAKLAATEEKLAGAEKKNEELQQQMLRTMAEYDNYRKRSQKEHDAAFSNGVAHAAESLLPVLDTLEAAANAPTSDEEYKKGVLMILATAQEVFGKMGIQEMDCEGKPFDPELHSACAQEACKGVDSGCVARVLQKGYTLNGRVIRHAVVAVAP